MCTKCIYVTWLWVTSMLWSCLKVWFMLNQTRTKALSDQMSFRSISKCWYYLHIVANVFSFVVFYFYMTHDQLLSVMQTPSGEILLRNQHPWFHGAADLTCHTGISTFTYLRYLCVCCHLCWCICPKKPWLYMFVFYLTKNTWPQERSQWALCNIHAAVCWRVSVSLLTCVCRLL